MRKLLIVALVYCVPTLSYSQEKQSAVPAFSEWSLRFNPASFFETLGGVHMGVETNIDRKQKWYVVSEYGVIFINNFGRYDEGVEGGRNSNRVSGFETKQELRLRLKSDGGRYHFVAMELHYLQAGIDNSGWFGMGETNPGQYTYYKHQDFRESARETSVAVKYGGRFLSRQRLSLEMFAGFGVIYTDISYTNTEGKLYQLDKETVFKPDKDGFAPYTALGIRLCFRL